MGFVAENLQLLVLLLLLLLLLLLSGTNVVR